MEPCNDIHFFESMWLKHVGHEDGAPSYRSSRESPNDIFDLRVLAAPYGVDVTEDGLCTTHWSLCVAFIQAKVIVVYDNHPSSATHLHDRGQAAQLMLKWVRQQFEARYPSLNFSDSGWIAVATPTPCPPSQSLAADCGVFVCSHALALARGNALSLHASGVFGMRLYITQCLLQGKLLGIDASGQ